MLFYHGTTKRKWKLIKKEGVLWGIRNAPSRCTYLTTDKNEAKRWGEILLKVKYTPQKGNDNYVEGCWQFRIYVPIYLSKVDAVNNK